MKRKTVLRLTFRSLFCRHKWEQHMKVETTYPQIFDLDNNDKKVLYSLKVTREILICKDCGTIVKLEY